MRFYIIILSYNYNHNQDTKHFHYHKKFLWGSSPLIITTAQETNDFLSIIIDQNCLFQNSKQIELYIIFCVLSFCSCFGDGILIAGYITTSFLFNAKQYSIVWTYHYLYIHSPVDGYLGCFQVGAITNKDAINIHEQVLYGHVFISSW